MRKLKAAVPKMRGCLNAGPERSLCPLTMELSVGFGSVDVTRNGKTVWSGDMNRQFAPVDKDMKHPMRLRRFELMARKNKGDWRVFFNAPLNGSLFQRQGKNKWVLVKQTQGFA